MQVIGQWKDVYHVELPTQSLARRDATKAAGTSAIAAHVLP